MFTYGCYIVYFRLGNDFHNYWSFSVLVLGVLNRDFSLVTDRCSTLRQNCFRMDGALFVALQWVEGSKVISLAVLCTSTEGPRSVFWKSPIESSQIYKTSRSNNAVF